MISDSRFSHCSSFSNLNRSDVFARAVVDAGVVAVVVVVIVVVVDRSDAAVERSRARDECACLAVAAAVAAAGVGDAVRVAVDRVVTRPGGAAMR